MRKVFVFLLIGILSWGLAIAADNLVKNPSFEEEGLWKGGARTTEMARTGTFSLKFTSTSATVHEGKKMDWVTRHSLSNSVEVKEGETYWVSCWINIPEPLMETKRGAILNLNVHNESDDKWQLIFLKEKNVSTSGWEKVEGTYTIRPGMDKLQVRLGICGIGTVYFDDVELSKE